MINSKYWNLSYTLAISFIVLIIFTLTQSLVLIFLKSQNTQALPNVYETLVYSNLGLISSISSALRLLALILFIKIKNKELKDYLNLITPKISHILLFFFASFFLMFVMEKLSHYNPVIFETDFVLKSYKQATSLPVLYIGVVFLGPFFEEALFRGFLFKGLEKSFLGGHGAVFVTSFIFAMIHMTQYGVAVIFVMILPMSVLLGYARLYSQSLLLPIVLHVINNLITCLITHFEVY